MTAGVVVAGDQRGTWAWTAVRVDEAVDVTGLAGYAELPGHRRLEKAVAAETAWLQGQWDTTYDNRIELRYRTDPESDRMSCAVLGRVRAASPEEAVAAALALRTRLAEMPEHVHATPVTETAEVSEWLTPFPPDPAGLVEIRKRLRAAPPNRPDAGVRYYLSVQPFRSAASSWDHLWQALTAHSHPVVLSVGLQPCTIPDSVSVTLHDLATRYGRLAAPGRMPEGLWSSGVGLAPDAFAEHAARLYRDAAQRYGTQGFRIRITLASPAPIPESLAGRVAATVSENPGDYAGSGDALVVHPLPGELADAGRNLNALEHTRWDAEYLRFLPEPPPPVLRLLAELVDAREASAALRLPLAIHGRLPGFPVRGTETSVTSNVFSGTAQNVVQAGHIHGDVHIHQSAPPPNQRQDGPENGDQA